MSETEAPPARGLRERLLRPTLPELWTFLAVALPVLASLIAALSTVDLAYQLRAGTDILAGRGIPAVDTWTFTAAGQPWLDQQWGAQAVLAAVYAVAGWSGLAILRAALVGLTFGLILVAIRRRQPGLKSRVAAWLTLAAFIVAAPALALRPQLLAMACFALTLALLAGRRRRPRAVWLVPVVAIAWANLHGSFVFAPVLVGLAWLEDRVDHEPGRAGLFVVGLATLVATAITPFGIGVWGYAAGLATSSDVRAFVTEWQPTTLRDPTGLVFWISVGAVVLYLVRRGSRPSWPQLLTLASFAVVGAYAARGIAWWPLVAAVTVGAMLDGARGARDRVARPSAFNGVVAALLAVVALALLPAWRPVDPATGAPQGLLREAPSGITAALRDLVGPGDRVWNPQVWGSWFEYAVPEARYALDSRIERISGSLWREVVAVTGGDWCPTLGSTDTRTVVIEGPEEDSLLAFRLMQGGWQRAYADGDGSIWRWDGPVFDSDCRPGSP